MVELLNRWLLRGVALAWVCIVGAEYLFRNTHYLESFSDTVALTTLLLLLVLATLSTWLLRPSKTPVGKLIGRAQTITITGLSGVKLYLASLSFAAASFAVFGIQVDGFSNGVLPALAHFIGFSVLVHAAAFSVIVTAYVAGDHILRLIRIGLTGLSRAIVSIAIGFSVLIILLFLLGAMGLLNQWVVLVSFALIAISGRMRTLAFLKACVIKPLPQTKVSIWAALAGFVMLVFIGINLASVLMPLPLGFDAIKLYLNTAHLVSDYGALTQGGQAYNWSLFASIGFIVFKSTPVALCLMIVPAILSLLAVWQVARSVLSINLSIVAMALVYTIPVITWQSSNDVKVDLALLFMMVTALLLVVEHLRKAHEKTQREGIMTWLVAGFVMGTAFGIKYTAALGILALLVIFAYRQLGKMGLAGSILLSMAALLVQAENRFGSLLSDSESRVLMISLAIVGVGLLAVAAVKERSRLRNLLLHGAVFLGASMLVFAPWAIKHVTENNQVSLHSVLEGKSALQNWRSEVMQRSQRSASPAPPFIPAIGYESVPVGDSTASHGQGGIREELTRYMGYEEGAVRYLSLPYDVTMRANVEDGNLGLDPGFVGLMFLPLLFLAMGRRSVATNLAGLLLMIVTWLLYQASLTDQGKESIFNLIGNTQLAQFLLDVFSRQSGLWSVVIVLGLALTIAFLHKRLLSGVLNESKYLIVFFVSFMTLWLLFASGVTWYALPGLAIMPIVILSVHGKSTAAVATDRFMKTFIALGLGAWLTFAIGLRLSDFEPTDARVSGPFHASLLPFMAGDESSAETLNRLNPAMVSALNAINSDPSARVLRIGTQITYFIDRNDGRVMEDNQLDYFERTNRRGTRASITRRLRQSGFRYIVVDLNTPALDQTPEQTLVKKFQHLMEYLSNNGDLKLISTDRMIVDPTSRTSVDIDGQRVPVKYGFDGSVAIPGSIAVFEIT